MQKSTRSRTTLFFLALLAGNLSAEAAEIQFKAQADVRGSLVLLGDIANIQDLDPQKVETLRRIELFPSPARGRVRTLRNVEIRQLLQLHGVSTAEHRFAGAELIRIGHAKSTAASLGHSEPHAKSETTQQQIVVAKQPIATGTVIRAADIELKASERPVANGSLAASTEDVVGHESTRSYSAGQAIDLRSLRKPILVRRGDAVAVVAKAAGVRVRTTAKALADGAFGEVIPVESQDREKFSVVVSGSREAEVFASGSTVSDRRHAVAGVPENLH